MRAIRPRAAIAALLSILGSTFVVACESAIASPDAGARADARAAIERDAAIDEDAAIGDDAAIDEEDAGARDAGARDADARDGGQSDGAIDAGRSDAGPSGVPIFVAQGYQDRTTISCDDGRTWIANRSSDDSVRCFTGGGPDCDHQPGRAKGIVYSRGSFVGTWGWGAPGAVRRTRDGRTWEETTTGRTYGGIAGGADAPAIVLGAHAARRSTDDGASWSGDVETGLAVWNVRRAGYVPQAGGRWILVGEDGGESDVVLSSDGGETFWHPSSIPGSCGQAIQNDGGIGWAPGVIAIVGGDGTACRSTDGGETWSASSLGTSVSSSDVISTGTEMLVWGGGRRFRSTDGATWTAADITPGVTIGAVGRSEATGTLVAVNAGWDQWYERQRWYRSTDGIAWEVLPESAAVRSHPMHQIAFGIADASACE